MRESVPQEENNWLFFGRLSESDFWRTLISHINNNNIVRSH